MYDIAIIGGGAAGLFSAIYIKKQRPDLSVVLLEGLDRVGKKLITTGNGRCNITNSTADVSDYHGASADFIKSVFDRFFVTDAVDFFKTIGVETVFESDGKGYPASLQASSVVDAMRLACDELGVKTLCSFYVTDIKAGDVFVIKSTDNCVKAKKVLMTGGLLSGGKKVGSDGYLLSLAKRMGHRTVAVTPAIVQVKTDTEITRQLKGIKLNATATLSRGERILRREYGEVLFTDYGLSGPPILQLSRGAEAGTTIALDLFPKMTENELCDMLKTRSVNISARTAENYLTGLVNKRVGQVVLKYCGIKPTLLSGEITNHKEIAKMLKDMRFEVMGNTGFANSQVSTGGISHKELTENLESKKVAGLFFAGEIIDVDGDCGGYNLQWAWSSGAVSSEGMLACF